MTVGVIVFRAEDSAATGHARQRKRQKHRKTKAGCLPCKTRRIKCDELRPTCSGCTRKKLQCEYKIDRAISRSHSLPWRKITSIQHLSRTSTATLISDGLLAKGMMVAEPLPARPTFSTEDLMLLEHYRDFTALTIGPPATNRVYRKEVVDFALENPSLMYTILTFTDIHIRFLKADYGAPVVKELEHFQCAISGYRTALAHVDQGTNADALLATATLMSGIALALRMPQDLEETWPLTERDEDHLWWLRLQNGIGLVRDQTLDHLAKGPFRSLWEDDMDGEGTSEQYDHAHGPHSQQFATLIAELNDQCEIKAPSNERNPYAAPLEKLTYVLNLASSNKLLINHMQFLTQLGSSYTELLGAKDHRALLLLCIWQGKVATLPCWWSQMRSQLEHRSIAIYLERHANPKLKGIVRRAFKGLCMSSRASQARSCSDVPDVKEFCHAM